MADQPKGVDVITVRDVDVHHWFWRLDTLARDCPDLPQALLAGTLASSLRREAWGLYADAPVVRIPEDLAMAVLDCLEALAPRARGRLKPAVADDARILTAALAAA